LFVADYPLLSHAAFMRFGPRIAEEGGAHVPAMSAPG
jgi:hypothetical protein